MNIRAALESSLRASSALKEIAIDEKAVADLADSLSRNMPDTSEAHFLSRKWALGQAFKLTLIFNSVNFCYWAEKGKEKWAITIDGQKLGGSLALMRLFEGLAAEKPGFFEWQSMSDWVLADFETVFAGSNVEIPLLQKRYENLVALAQHITREYAGDSELLLTKSHNHAGEMLERLLRMSCFEDESSFAGQKVYFWKRAQLQVKMFSDISLAQGGQPMRDLHLLTAFADYKVPQILRHIGILQYSPRLAQKIDGLELIEAGSDLENEIRTATIAAVDKIARSAQKPAAQIDSYLWGRAASNQDAMKPYHRTYTSAY